MSASVDVLAAQVRAALSLLDLEYLVNAMPALDVLVGYAKRAERLEQASERVLTEHGETLRKLAEDG